MGQLQLLELVLVWTWCLLAMAGEGSSSAPCHSGDLQALLAIRAHFPREAQLARSWVGTECCTWPHVRCDEPFNSRVISLHLSNMSASLGGDAIPGAAISKLSMLRSLVLSGNALAGNLHLAHLSNLSMLRVLDLSNNRLGGYLQDALLFGFPKLQRLSLSDNNLGGRIPSSLCDYFPVLRSLDLSGNSGLAGGIPAGLPQLQLLDLSWNPGLGGTIPASLCGLSNLKSLSLADCALDGEIPGCLGDLHLLEHLDLSGNNLKGHLPIQLCLLYGLRSLDLSGNSLSGPIPACLGAIQTLESLLLMFNYFDSFLGHLGNLTRLVELSVGGSRLTVSSNFISSLCLNNNSKLSTLEIFYLESNNSSSTNATFNDFSCLFSLPNLSALTLVGFSPPLTSSITSHITSLTKLQLLDLSENQLSGSLPSFLANLTQLQTLSLSGNQLSGSLPSFLAHLTQLQFLDLSANQLSGSLPSFLANLTQLQSLDLSGNQLSGSLPSFLANLTQLQTLSLSANQLSGSLPSFPSGLPLLNDIDLGNNRFTGTIPSAWQNLSNLLYLSLSNNRLHIEQLPSWLSRLPSLLELDLSSCGISSLPCGFLPPSLEYLDLSNNKLGKHALLCLARSSLNLQFLSLTGNPLEDQLPARMECLTKEHQVMLSMSSCRLRGRLSSTFLNGIINASNLDLSRNDLSGAIPSEIGSMQSLSSLDLSHNRFSGELPPSLANCSGLRYIHLGDNLLQGRIPPAMGRQLISLQVLSLPGNRLSGDIISFGNCNQLKLLDLSNNSLTGTLHDLQFSNLSTLRVLVLASNNMTGLIPDTLGNFSQALQLIDLSHNNFIGTIPRSLQLPAFSSTNLSYKGTLLASQGTLYEEVKMTSKGTMADYFYVLQALVALNLQENSLDGTIPDSLGSLCNMVILNLSHNHLTGPIPPYLSNLLDLQSLDLSSNLLTGPIPAQFSTALTQLETFNVAYNNLSGPIPQGNQFNTFNATSYEGNDGLCGGDNILKPCTASPAPPVQTPQNNFQVPTPPSQLILNFIATWVSLPALFLSYSFSFIATFWLLHRR